MTGMSTRREMIERLAKAAGAVVLLPVAACKREDDRAGTQVHGIHAQGGRANAEPVQGDGSGAPKPIEVPKVRDDAWNPLAFNRERGNSGAIPASYLPDINGPQGDKEHLGKHLPYVPKVDASLVPQGYLAVMWGDASKGHAEHPNEPRSPEHPDGHWYSWVRLRKATAGDALEVESVFTNWPAEGPGSTGKYAARNGTEITANEGKNTIYLLRLPTDCHPGDTIRVWGHCITHGEYVDFLTI